MEAALLGLGAWMFCGCMSGATPEDIQKMCENFAHLNGADQMPSKEALIADVDAMFNQLDKDVKATRDDQIKLWEKDLQVQLANSKDEAQKASLQTLLEERKKQAEEKMQLDLASFAPRRAEELAKIDEQIKKAKTDFDAEIKKCVDKANAEKITQELAKCRSGAKTLDMYNQVCY
jgi:hypothetical protein